MVNDITSIAYSGLFIQISLLTNWEGTKTQGHKGGHDAKVIARPLDVVPYISYRFTMLYREITWNHVLALSRSPEPLM